MPSSHLILCRPLLLVRKATTIRMEEGILVATVCIISQWFIRCFYSIFHEVPAAFDEAVAFSSDSGFWSSFLSWMWLKLGIEKRGYGRPLVKSPKPQPSAWLHFMSTSTVAKILSVHESGGLLIGKWAHKHSSTFTLISFKDFETYLVDYREVTW